MRLSQMLVTAAVSSLMAVPAIARPAASLSVANSVSAKTSTPSKKSNSLVGLAGTPLVIVGVVAAAVVIGGIAIVASDDDNDPDSN